jgi:predicted nucleotidyltransferase component of viral defense system
MLTRQQIQRLAQRHGIGLHAQERDYLQHLILFQLYSRTQEFIFKGGTALRLAYQGNRYSEDLDFNAPPDSDATLVETQWQMVVDGLSAYGIEAELRNPWQSAVGYSTDLSYQGPLFDGRTRTKGKVRLDVNLRPEIVATQRVLITSSYDDVRPFVVTAIAREHLFAEKVRALVVRGKPRDLYDLWLLLSQGVQAQTDLIREKLALYDLVWSAETWKAGLASVEAGWERDMRPLLSQYLPYADVRAQVEARLQFPLS